MKNLYLITQQENNKTQIIDGNTKEVLFESVTENPHLLGIAKKMIDAIRNLYISENGTLQQEFFPITSISREDISFLESINVDEAKVMAMDDYTLASIADDLGEAIMDSYWISLPIIVEDRYQELLLNDEEEEEIDFE